MTALGRRQGGPPVTGRRPRVGVDCHAIVGIHQGIRTHVLEIFGRVPLRAPELDFVFLTPEPENLRSLAPGFSAPNASVAPIAHCGPLRRLLWELPLAQHRNGLDLLHVQYIAPPVVGCPIAVTIHDVLFETHPQFFTRSFTLRSRVLMRRAAARSALVFSVSEFSRRELARLYGVPAERIAVTPNAADLARFSPGRSGAEVVRRAGLEPGGYVLTVGRLEPRKNQANLIRAHAQLGPGAPPLVLVGQRHFGYREVSDLVASAGGRVLVLEDVEDADLPAWYRNAQCFAYTSWAEGFGMPVIEAFASGVPVVCSDTTALGEIATGAARLVAPGDVDSIAAALRDLLGDERLRAELAQRGLERARAFGWDGSAAVLADRYRAFFGTEVEPAPVAGASSTG